ncbi:MAG: hypothetical protein AAGA60_14110 [Cyanobacteria bacterium P01_E01_bin.42]
MVASNQRQLDQEKRDRITKNEPSIGNLKTCLEVVQALKSDRLPDRGWRSQYQEKGFGHNSG